MRYENLKNIPLVEIWSDDRSKCFYQSHGRLNVKIHLIEINGTITNNPKQENISFLSTKFSALLSNRWVKKWGCTWNIDWIKLAQCRLAEKLYYTDFFVFKLLARNKKIMIAWFWFLVFRKAEFDKRGFLIK